MDERQVVAAERVLELLDFTAIRVRLGLLCVTPFGQRLTASLVPVAARRAVEASLGETDEARRLLDLGTPPPVGGLEDIGPHLARARRGGLLDGRELLAVGVVAAACRRLRGFFAGHDGTPRLADWAGRLREFPELEAELARCLDEDGSLRDEASPHLAELRRQQRRHEDRVREKLDQLVRSAAVQPYLQEAIVTLRGDRFVLPVRIEHRAQVPGVVHDQSSSGATVFVEPLAVVELNNELRRLAAEERDESERLLRALAGRVGAHAAEFDFCLDILAHLDLAGAKARLSAEEAARAPELDGVPGLQLHHARHPLLREPVPLELRLGGADGPRALVVTGPNTGGKTVALKTAGLLACMAQAGLHIPAGDGSRLGPFPQIFCDVGDEQGVAQNLSTFSSHLTQLVRVVAAAGPGALVLLDELGAGTDPAEGAALGIALLEQLLARGTLLVATTHYSELIAFAYRHPLARNASVEFDSETLQPTYRLVTGLPGRSNAFAIAQRLGLDGGIVGRARELLGADAQHLDRLIADIAADERRTAQARAEAEAQRETAARLLAEAQRAAEEMRLKAARQAEAARAEAAQALREAKRAADDALRQLRRLLAEADRDSLQAAEAVRAELREAAEAVAEPLRRELPPVAAPRGGWRAGQGVHLRTYDLEGVLRGAPDAAGQVVVQVGVLRVTVPVAEIEPGRAPAVERSAATFLPAAPAVSPECDLRGLTVEEALERVDKYLDDAVLAGLGRVRLIHGKGTGALRAAVLEYLRGHPQLAGVQPGAGATEVELRGADQLPPT